MSLLATLSTALTGKAAAALAGVTLAGGGLAVAVDAAQPAEDANADVDQVEIQDDGAEDDGVELLVETTDTPEDGTEDRGRSEAVHDALTGGEAEPGDEDFGEIVSDNARNGGKDFGQNVADAARDGAGESESAEGRARAEEAQESTERGQADEGPEAGQQRAEQAREERAPESSGAETADEARQDEDAQESRPDNPGPDAARGGR
jgi:hypothetical protein